MAGSLAERIGEVLAGEGEALQFEGAWRAWPDLARIAGAVQTAVGPVPRDLAIAHVSRNRPSGAATLLGLLAERRCVLQISAIQPATTLAAEIERLAPAAIVADRDDWAPAVVAAAKGVGALGVALDGDQVSVHPELGRAGEGPHHPAPEGVGLMMPTSGTTGPPKRVPVTFKQLETYRADRDANRDTAPKPGPPRVIIIASPLFTVTGLRPFLAFATRPLRLVLMEKVDVTVWAALVARHRPREGGLPPAAMKMLLDSDAPRDSLSCLTSWNTGSAPVDPDIAARFEAEFGVPVLVSYGATEFGGAVASTTLADRAQWGTRRGSSGRAMPGNRLRVVDPDTGAELSPGESGLLEVDAVRTGGGWTRTNDIAHIDADGFLYIEGRADDVIIRGGFKVPLLEVEATLVKHPDVAQVAVLAEDDERLGQVPVAAVVPRAGAHGLTGEAVGEWAREQMAPYKRPVRIAVLEALPMTASMKVNRPELRRVLAEVFQRPAGG